MSSVAVLTQESFAEHRSGLVPQQMKGECPFVLIFPFGDTATSNLCQTFRAFEKCLLGLEELQGGAWPLASSLLRLALPAWPFCAGWNWVD